MSTRQKTGIDQLKQVLVAYRKLNTTPLFDPTTIDESYFASLQKAFQPIPLQALAGHHPRRKFYQTGAAKSSGQHRI